MSTTRDLFFSAVSRGIAPGNREQLELFEQAASQWRASGQFLNAAYAMSRAVHAAWGDGPRVEACFAAQLRDYRNCVENQSPDSHESLVALWKWSNAVQLNPATSADVTSALRAAISLQEELAQRLVQFFDGSPNADSYLVRGFVIKSDMEETWQPSFPEYEVVRGEERWGDREVSVNMPSAFHIFTSRGDYYGAQQVIERHPDAFGTPGLRGWRSAVEGFLRPVDAAESFAEAASAFAEDKVPSNEELLARGEVRGPRLTGIFGLSTSALGPPLLAPHASRIGFKNM
jgi:hypothetical protein